MKINDAFSKFTKSNLLNNHIKRVINDDTFAAKTLVVCAVAKDVFAYSTRYKTTKENKKIPEEQRGFVAAMDLASGAVTSVLQLGVGFAVASKKFQDALWNKMFSNVPFKDVKVAKKTFAGLVTLAVSGILTERLLVPLIATPIAEKFEKGFKPSQKNSASGINKTSKK